jgi:hypothetical protein
MSIGLFIFFLVWLALALAGGALIVVVWERMRSRYATRDKTPER